MVTAIDFLLGKELLEVGRWGLALNAICFPCYLLYKQENIERTNATHTA